MLEETFAVWFSPNEIPEPGFWVTNHGQFWKFDKRIFSTCGTKVVVLHGGGGGGGDGGRFH